MREFADELTERGYRALLASDDPEEVKSFKAWCDEQDLDSTISTGDEMGIPWEVETGLLTDASKALLLKMTWSGSGRGILLHMQKHERDAVHAAEAEAESHGVATNVVYRGKHSLTIELSGPNGRATVKVPSSPSNEHFVPKETRKKVRKHCLIIGQKAA